MLKKILLILLAAVLAFAAYVAMLPPQFRVARGTTINAPAAKVFPHVNDFKKWQAWSPWAKLDPNAKATFEGPVAGKDAVFKWSGNDEVGEGKMTIVESRPDEAVRIKLDFTKPFENSSDVALDLKSVDGKTEVTWSMSGEQNFLMRAMCVVFRGQSMMEREYDKGLASLKSIVESGG